MKPAQAKFVGISVAGLLLAALVFVASKPHQAPPGAKQLTVPISISTISRPVTISLLPSGVLIPQNESVSFRFSVPDDASEAKLEGEFTAAPSPRATLRMTISIENKMAESQVYDSEYTSADAFRIPLKAGNYVLVFENNAPSDSTNSFWPDEKRQAITKVRLSYKRSQ